ncbi:hypothetical protein IPZ58_36345 [Streptomyces roseoverticillatus]|uniref:hypothetical protein n=1 Tax=Streptomyces roseoverticillatus TaxID=66429 RepID=UPI001F166359|nr:hypothetical protein [Streptomyces roseoverticillatus]MCF3106986.1 hypothetical protein [Streptomyces roseoverticillatus]
MGWWGKSADDGSAGRILEAITGLKGELGKAVRDGFLELRRQNSELREELRELRRTVQDVHKDVAEHRRETAAMRQELRAETAARREAAEILTKAGTKAEAGAEVRTEAEAKPDDDDRADHRDPVPEAGTGEDAHDKRLEKAAGISAAELICHRDTWAFIVEQAARNAHFRVPGEVTGAKDGATSVVVSGRSLMAILTALNAVRQQGHGADPGDGALARKFYDRIVTVVDTVGPAGHRPQAAGHAGAETPQRAVIVIDDRPGPQASGSG